MKVWKLLSIMFGAVLLVSASAFAADTNKGGLHLSDPVTVEGKSIKPGDYTVQWSGEGTAVQVTISQGKHTVATLSGRLTDQDTANPQDAYGTNEGPDGTRLLTSIYPAHKKIALVFDQSAGTSQGN